MYIARSVPFRLAFPILFSVFLLCLFLPGEGKAFHLFGKGPESAITLAQKGIDESNPEDFNKAVNVPAIVDKATDALMDAMQQLLADGALDNSNLGMMLSLVGAVGKSGQADIVKQLLGTEIRSFVNTGIKSGYFSGKEEVEVKASGGSLSSLITRLAKGRRVLKPGEILEEKDDTAVMNAVFADPKAGEFPLKLGLERKEGNWQVVEILNARDLFNEALQRNR